MTKKYDENDYLLIHHFKTINNLFHLKYYVKNLDNDAI